MTEAKDPVVQKLLEDLKDPNLTDDVRTAHIKTLKTYAEAKKLLEPDPIPEPEPSGVKGFFGRHAGDLIKSGTTLVVVGAIAILEAKGDVIFRSKATKYI